MKPFATRSVFLLALIAALQFLRFMPGWEIIVSGLILPLWLGAIAFVITLAFAIKVCQEDRSEPV